MVTAFVTGGFDVDNRIVRLCFHVANRSRSNNNFPLVDGGARGLDAVCYTHI